MPFLRSVILILSIVLLSSGRVAALEPADQLLLQKIEQDSLQYFIRLSDKVTGLTRDSSRSGSPASISATGFALAAIAVGESRGWIEPKQAQDQILKTLRTLDKVAEHQNGFFYHFLDPKTGSRIWKAEVSSIDTALLVAGALTAAQYHPGTEIDKLAKRIYARVNWSWMLNGSHLMCMGWKPETGFLPYYWDSYSEHLILHALAIGSPTYPIPAELWHAWLRNEDIYENYKVVFAYSGSLFTYQYAHAFIDFRNLNDRGINYFENSKNATLANHLYSLKSSGSHKGYSEISWGLSASVGPGGYKAYGSKPGQGLHDGTIAPYAAISAIVFTPEKSIPTARHFYEAYGENIYGKYGFKGAFNIDKNWWSEEYLGIDQGITVLMLENFLNNGILWKKFGELESTKVWISKTGLDQPSQVTPAS